MAEMFGPYAVVALVGEGSTGRVFRARHVELGRDAAVKELAESVRGAPGVSERLRAEAERLAGLSHPNIVALYDYVEEPGRSWLAEQWVEGARLERILAVHGRLSPEQALGVVRGAVLGSGACARAWVGAPVMSRRATSWRIWRGSRCWWTSVWRRRLVLVRRWGRRRS